VLVTLRPRYTAATGMNIIRIVLLQLHCMIGYWHHHDVRL